MVAVRSRSRKLTLSVTGSWFKVALCKKGRSKERSRRNNGVLDFLWVTGSGKGGCDL
jgi:hypothetical protein